MFSPPGPAVAVIVGYTIGMKTAVSLPDDVFRSAELFAKRARKSRSRLYAEALSDTWRDMPRTK